VLCFARADEDRLPLPSCAHARAAGYVDDTTYEAMWPQTVENIRAFLEGKPIREMEAEPEAGVH
jgi:hypothetical protein